MLPRTIIHHLRARFKLSLNPVRCPRQRTRDDDSSRADSTSHGRLHQPTRLQRARRVLPQLQFIELQW